MNQTKYAEICRNIRALESQIRKLSCRAHTPPKLLAVSKNQPIEKIRRAYDAGLRDFGESYVKEACEKIPSLPKDIRWHFIGVSQSNKLKPIAENFHFVHTLSSLKHAEKLSRHAALLNKKIAVCLQINVDRDRRKSGIDVDNHQAIEVLSGFVLKSASLLELKGLMCILAHTKDHQKAYASFCRLSALKAQLEKKLQFPLDTLSMGMSGDLAAAVSAGSTIVRIGTGIFGAQASQSEH